MKLARNSRRWISVPIILTAVLAVAGNWYISAAAFMSLIFMVFFHRDPDRLPQSEGMLSPADGRIIQATPEKVTVFMGLGDVHVNRAPLDGTIISLEHRKGTHLPAFLNRASQNQQSRMRIETEDGEIQLSQITGTIVREIVCYVKPGDHVLRGERIGMIRFGSRVETSIPRGYKLQVSLGDSVRAGKTVIAVKLHSGASGALVASGESVESRAPTSEISAAPDVPGASS
ncbi:MAG: phosphatidylserine decarboxylase [Methanothrix sp.]|uniref:phosphatidylserine decarboxylase n=1 Tax=Methanothrix sp. TaxID=90426 RepID=UPI003BB01C42